MLFRNFFKNIRECFRPRNLPWHFLAIVLTFLITVSGLDWLYFISLKNSSVYPLLFPATLIGGLFPIAVPLTMLAVGRIRRNARLTKAGWGVGQAGLLGLIISSAYKFFTGRLQPPSMLLQGTLDVSNNFRFGFFRGGIFWGWPSSHTTIAFATAITLVFLYPEKRWVKTLAIAYAIYVALGVSISIHWLSDVVAGAIIGTVIGIVVGKDFFNFNSEKPLPR